MLKSVITSMPHVRKENKGSLSKNFNLSALWGMGTLQIGIIDVGCNARA